MVKFSGDTCTEAGTAIGAVALISTRTSPPWFNTLTPVTRADPFAAGSCAPADRTSASVGSKKSARFIFSTVVCFFWMRPESRPSLVFYQIWDRRRWPRRGSGLVAAASRMALVAIRAVVDVAANPRVREISRIPPAVAAGALEHGVVVRIRVAGCADALGVPVSHWEPSVIECRACPSRGRMASLTRRREAGRRVVRIRRARVIGLVATVAVRGQRRVIVVHVAARACDGRVRASERKRRVVVVKRGIGPRSRVVAQITSCRKARVVHGSQSAVKVSLVAADAGGVGGGHRVIVIHVARGARDRLVRPSQRPSGRGVVERSDRPRRR